MLNIQQERGTLITGNARLSRQLRREYDTARRKQGERLWESPDILPRDAWLLRCWRECAYRDPLNTAVLLDAAQEQVLWEQAIAESASEVPLLDIRATASVAARAWDLLHHWEAQRAAAAFEGLPDCEAFFRWMNSVERKLRASGWITASEVPRALLDRIAAGSLEIPGPLSYAGFDELTPADRRLFDALAMSEAPKSAEFGTRAYRAAFHNTVDELEHAAGWARSRLETAPASRIGVVVHGLAALSPMVESIFDDVLHPGLDFAPSTARRAFHVSAGVPSSETPVIAAALLTLRLRDGISLTEAGMLLRSPFLRIGAARGARLDAELRRHGIDEISLDVDLVRPHVRDYETAARELPPLQRPSQWSAHFSRVLALAGWPGERALSSAEFETVEHWKSLLSEFAGLDLVLPPIDWRNAVERLEQIAKGGRFAPSDEDAPVQIMDVLEAAGSRFDALWIAGLHGGMWPPLPHANPFLSVALQRAAGMPRCSPERELSYARLVTARLLSSAPEVVCSHPLYSGEEKLRVSPLFEHLPEIGTGVDRWTAPPATAVRVMFSAAPDLDVQPIGDAPPLAAGVDQTGGSRVLEDQAACPFRAFAIHRLGARELDAPELGVSPRERGSAAHVALESLWRELKSQQQLKALSPAELSGLIQSSARAALDRTLHRRKNGAIEQFRILEQERLERLLETWLEKEKERAPFEIAELEISTMVELGGLKLRIKADRVDRESSGAHAILDYKTAKELSLAGWYGDRPDSPQLPLYAVMSGYPVSKIFFAQLSAGKMGLLPPEGADAEQHGPEWKRVLEQLAVDFFEGRAAVDPKVPKKTCELCRLQSLCRVGEIRRVEAGDFDE